ncbi:glycosyltransferase [Sphingomonas nostoxanthinifaciens]|uniref:glycosyltransferase n=1 Tax=Sphingomonas nostoxanthinifaciens TaxID=2872652 RepID=UPI001CC1C90C|nr:glycosyltransferase [Sphingomonas nostoxanthinifaciens]UAK24995.1 glycosyltransferase [Sphingomonas nostoxanthinifaciens]
MSASDFASAFFSGGEPEENLQDASTAIAATRPNDVDKADPDQPTAEAIRRQLEQERSAWEMERDALNQRIDELGSHRPSPGGAARWIGEKLRAILGNGQRADTAPTPASAPMSADALAELAAERELIATSNLFDERYYRAQGPAFEGDAIVHFCTTGWREQKSPSEAFDVGFYLATYPDVAQAGVNPLVHWLRYGRPEGRNALPPHLALEAEAPRRRAWDQPSAINSPSIIFITHEGSQTGAPMVLLSLLRWLRANTDIDFSIVIGADGPLDEQFEAIAPCFHMVDYADGKKLRDDLRRFCGLNVQLVYMNTIVSGIYGNQLRFLNADFIAHVHEMEAVFQIFEEPFRLLASFCDRFVAVADGAAEAIRRRTQDREVKITVLPPFIEVPDHAPASLTIEQGPWIIYGCGTAESRKGADLFCDVAEELIKLGRRDFKMRWIGRAGDIALDQLIKKRGLGQHVEWLGAQNKPSEFFDHGALFLLPSREDPFPLVCLEAADRGLPVICFADAGAMPTFVEQDAGIVVPYLDVAAMAGAAAALLDDQGRRHSLGARARAKVKERAVVDVIAPKILDLLPALTESTALTEFEAYCEQIDRAGIVSFDIFDTLVTRLVSEPERVFDVAEHRHSRREVAVLDLFSERMRAAGTALGRYNGAIDDVSIDEIYEEMAFFRDASIEKQTECDICTPHPLGARLFAYAIAQGKPVFIASDMYLDSDTIVAMLTKCGIAGWDSFFLSSARGLKKDTGRLYPLLIERAALLGYPADQILHIGDNWEGDVVRARAAGLHAARFLPLYENRAQAFPLSSRHLGELSQIGRLWNSFRTQACRLWQAEDPGLAGHIYTRLGFELTGPLAAMMAMHVRAQADRLGATKIVFMARDGRIIRKAFERLYAREIADGTYMPIYAHLSRATVVGATLQNPLSSSDLYFLIEGLHLSQKKISYYLAKAGLDGGDERIVAAVEGLFPSVDHVPGWAELTPLMKLLSGLSDSIAKANAAHRLYLDTYLRTQEIVGDDRVVVVDVGWLLNIQSRLDRFLQERGIATRLFGVYVGSRDRTDKTIPHASLLFDGGDPKRYADLIEQNTTLFELLFSSAEPSATGFHLNADGEVEVKLKNLTYPPDEELIAARHIHLGAEQFFDRFADALASFFPERVSRDFLFAAFDALVHSDNAEAHAKLGRFEVRLGGHHEFVVHEKLLRASPVALPVTNRREYFAPLLLSAAQGPHVTIVTAAGLDNGSTRYRGIHLGHSLEELGFAATLIHSATPNTVAQQLFARSQAVIFQRCFDEQQNVGTFMEAAQSAGCRRIMEIDDLVFPEFVHVIGSVAGGEWDFEKAMEIATKYARMMERMDAAIVSTPVLERYVTTAFGMPTALYRNRIRRHDDPLPEKSREIRLIYAAGTFSHAEDFRLIADALYDVLREFPQAQLSLLGAVQPPARLLSLPGVSSYPLMPYRSMLRFIAQHDLMLVPLVNSAFNRAKSNVKFLECGAMGVPVMASRVGEYVEAISDDATGLLVDDDLWPERLRGAIRDRTALGTIGDAARALVRSRFDVRTVDSTTADRLTEALGGRD